MKEIDDWIKQDEQELLEYVQEKKYYLLNYMVENQDKIPVTVMVQLNGYKGFLEAIEYVIMDKVQG